MRRLSLFILCLFLLFSFIVFALVSRPTEKKKVFIGTFEIQGLYNNRGTLEVDGQTAKGTIRISLYMLTREDSPRIRIVIGEIWASTPDQFDTINRRERIRIRLNEPIAIAVFMANKYLIIHWKEGTALLGEVTIQPMRGLLPDWTFLSHNN